MILVTDSLVFLFLSLVLVNEVAERLAFFAIAVNMVAYLVFETHQSLPSAATHVTDRIGAAYVLTLLGAFLADAYLGRFLTIMIFSFVYTVVSSISIDMLTIEFASKIPDYVYRSQLANVRKK